MAYVVSTGRVGARYLPDGVSTGTMAPMTNERLANRSVWPLTAPVLAPACLVAWVVATTITENGVFGVVLVPLAFVLVALVRRPVEEYIVSRGPARPALWEGLVQFTPGYFEFHAARRGVVSTPAARR